MKYKVYAGLSGGFGGANFIGIYDCESEEAALEIGYEAAVDEYQSYEGSHGIQSWEDCKQDAIETGWIDPNTTDDEALYEDIVTDMYTEALESWITYYVEEVPE